MKISDEIMQEFGSLLPFKATQGLKYSEIEKALSAVLPKLMVKVKPLEWDEYGDSFISGEYRVRENKDSDKEKFPVVLSMSEDFLGVFVNESSAIECAQADYERRMLEGLEIVKDGAIIDEGTKSVDVVAVRRQALEINFMQRVWANLYFDEHDAGYTFQQTLNDVVEWLTSRGAMPDVGAIRALSAEPAQGEQWQPIETAPKDGKIDIWAIDNGGVGRRVSDCYYDRICDEWRTSSPTLKLHRVKAKYATHWMPLPAAPTTEAET